MYAYPGWRRVPFVALLLVVIVLNYAPATTQGTTTIRLATLSAPGPVTHLYVQLAKVQLHQRGYLNNSGWVTISQAFPVVDLLSQNSQPTPPIVTSATVHSGSYDSITISFTNVTATVYGNNKQLSAPPSLTANMTMPVPPNGTGDLQIIVAFDYTPLFSTPASLSFFLVRVTAV